MVKPLAHSYSALKQYENCPKQYQMQRITKEIKPSFGEASIYGNRIHEQLDQRMKGQALPEESVKYEELCQQLELMTGDLQTEQEMTLNMRLEPTGWWDSDAWFRAKVDVLIRNNTKAVVIDWKTGKHRPDFFQLELFALQTFSHYPDIDEVKSCFVWLKDLCMDSEVYLRSEAPALWDKFHGKVKRIQDSLDTGNWPAKPSGLCPWCPAKNMCEFANI